MRVLIACEFSGTVRDAFRALGHDAMSCDLLPTEAPGPHYCGDVRDVLGAGWDLMVAHPPCTHLAVSGARWFKDKRAEQAEALDFVRLLMAAPIPRIAIENPVSVISSRIRKPDQTIQPWQFGHGETKATCLWLQELPKLTATDIVGGARSARASHAAWPGSMERAQQDVPRHRFRDGRAVGRRMIADILAAVRWAASLESQRIAHAVARRYVGPRRGVRGLLAGCRPNESNANAMDARALELEALP